MLRAAAAGAYPKASTHKPARLAPPKPPTAAAAPPRRCCFHGGGASPAPAHALTSVTIFSSFFDASASALGIGGGAPSAAENMAVRRCSRPVLKRTM